MSARGAVYIANKIGPSTEPWGTQQREAFDWWSAHLPL